MLEHYDIYRGRSTRKLYCQLRNMFSQLSQSVGRVTIDNFRQRFEAESPGGGVANGGDDAGGGSVSEEGGRWGGGMMMDITIY